MGKFLKLTIGFVASFLLSMLLLIVPVMIFSAMEIYLGLAFAGAIVISFSYLLTKGLQLVFRGCSFIASLIVLILLFCLLYALILLTTDGWGIVFAVFLLIGAAMFYLVGYPIHL